MKNIFLVALLVAAAILGVVAKLPSDKDLKVQFESFKRLHGKSYAGVEHDKRFEIFKQNTRKASILNARAEATYGATRFMDLTEAEFAHQFLMPAQTVDQDELDAHRAPLRSVGDLPTSWDWRTKGAVTPVKNQGQCGSCWSFSTTGAIEGAWFLAGNTLPSLSEQNLVDCDKECSEYEGQQTCDSGCGGGLPWSAYKYVIANGIEAENSYPYTAIDGTCKFSAGSAVAKISNWTAIPEDADQIAAALVADGPLSVALNAGWLQFYLGGVSEPLLCNPKSIDHAVLIVGYGVEGDKDFWIVKNSWGATWGEQGYFRMRKGKDTCGIERFATHPTV